MTTCDEHPDTCNFCGAAIFWAVTAKHAKCMPLDMDPNALGNVVLDDDGYAHVYRREHVPEGATVYMPHKASCEQWGVRS